MEGLQAASEDEEEEEPEIEYVEGYEELQEEDDDMEDFSGLGIEEDGGEDDNVGVDEDDEEPVAIDPKRGRKDSALALKKLERDEAGVKSKKKSRVPVEIEHEDTDERQTAVQ